MLSQVKIVVELSLDTCIPFHGMKHTFETSIDSARLGIENGSRICSVQHINAIYATVSFTSPYSNLRVCE